jgi:hypothetical protein
VSENPYAIPEEEFLRTVRVPVADQVEVQTENLVAPDWSSGALMYPDGTAGGADCD